MIEERPDGVLLRPAIQSPTAAERESFFNQLEAMVAETRQDAASWDAEMAERHLLPETLHDGLTIEPEWPAAELPARSTSPGDE